MDKGEIIPSAKFDMTILDSQRHCFLSVAGFENQRFDATNLWKNPNKNANDEEYFSRICPETKRDHSGRWARQVSNLETRGNEAFSGLINQLLQLQDTVPESKHLPNKGKKCLIFSDSRQQAANVAVELGQLSNHDETRRILFELLSKDWYQKLDSHHHSIAGMFPWFALFCGSKGINPFAGGQYSDDRSLLDAAGLNCLASILAAYALKFDDNYQIEFSPDKQIVADLVNELRPENKQHFTFDGLEFDQRKRKILRVLNQSIPSDRAGLSITKVKFKSFLEKRINQVKSSITKISHFDMLIGEFINEVNQNAKYEQYISLLSETKDGIEVAVNDPIDFGLFEGTIYRIKSILADNWLVQNMELVPLYRKCIDLTSEDNVREFFDKWNMIKDFDEALPLHQKEMGRWTNNWANFMVKILFDSEYGIEEIGIGYAQISEEYWNNLINKLPMNLKETFPEARYLIPRMLSHSYKRAKNTAKLRNAIFSEKRMPAFNPHNIDKDNPFKFNKETPGASDVTQLRQMLIENYKEDMPEKPVPLLNILITALAECNIITPSYSKKGINAEAIEIKPNVRG